MLLIAWQPHSYALRIIEATQQAIIVKECNQRQLECLPPTPMSQELLELIMIVGDTATSNTPLDALYHQTLKLVFSFYKTWQELPQQDGTHQVQLITAVSLQPDLVPSYDTCLPANHDWPQSMKVAHDAFPLAAPWTITNLHPMRTCSLPKLIQQVILDSPVESFSFRHGESKIFHKFTANVDGKPSTVAIDYDLHSSSHDHQHSKISSIEQSRCIP